MSKYIPLNRQFSPIFKCHEDAEELEISLNWGSGKTESWDLLLSEFRCVVLAEAGAGKTMEFFERAKLLEEEGKPSFFIRIEDIDRHFDDSFEIGDEDSFGDWLNSSEEAWFFLDSVDEAKLVSPRAFEKAIQRFSKCIQRGAHRAHIYISSRPYSWRANADEAFMDKHLFIASSEDNTDDGSEKKEPKSALKIYGLRPLNRDRIRHYCEISEVDDVDALLHQIAKQSLWSLAERPFDLDAIITKWADDKSLDGRLNLLRHNIDIRLKESHSLARHALNSEQARDGAQRLAAAVVLTGNIGINVPDSEHVKKGIEADTILYDWGREDVKSLLESALFNDIIYGAVRFRHRDIRELLAAEFFDKLLTSGGDRSQIESLFFKESFGESIVTPLMRPLLPWLILFDEKICDRTLKIKPEIAVEEGDPSQLSLSIRISMLNDIVSRIADNVNERSARDNIAIARIAQSDLTDEVFQLIDTYSENDDVIFFLGRLVWQGEMTSCTELLIPIAINSERGKYARIASIRAVMTCSSTDKKHSMWQALNEQCSVILRELLAELVDGSTPNETTVGLFLHSISKLVSYKEFEHTGLTNSLFELVERIEPIFIPQLLNGISTYLDTGPYIERRECRVSEEHAWLVGIALKSIEKLIINRDDYALSGIVLSTLFNATALKSYRGDDLQNLKHDLNTLIPNWPELNEALYWYSIESAREHQNENRGPLTDDITISWLEHFWYFDENHFPRLLDFMESRSLSDDRLVALNAAYRIYQRVESPVNMLEQLLCVAKVDVILTERLTQLLNPVVSESMLEFEKEQADRNQERKAKILVREDARRAWIVSLRCDLSKITNPAVEEGDITNNHVWLMNELEKESSGTRRESYAHWQKLIPEFGLEVATAYKEFCINLWRYYRPKLKSEEDVDNSIPGVLLLALAGLEMEAAEVEDFPRSLNSSDIDKALRYLTWGMNGFPSWFERMHQAFPTETEDAVLKEVTWELEATLSSGSLNHILHDLVYYAPWINEYIAPKLFDWLIQSPVIPQERNEYCVRILISGGVSSAQLSVLSRNNILLSQSNCDMAWWYSLFVDCDPDTGIPEFEQWLFSLDEVNAKDAAEAFIVALLGGRNSQKSLYCAGKFQTVDHLKSLYILMHRYIKSSEDIQRSGAGVYSPTLRDNAQEARNMLFDYLVKVPGKESYCAVKQLIEEHPDDNYRPWMKERAYKLAEISGDISPWSSKQFKDFHKAKIISPESHRQLFDLAVQQLIILKYWVECGNDSPWMTWQRAAEENEVRTLIAGELRKSSKGYYTIAEEPELANEQRMDIWLANPNVQSPVPIELKLLDKSWSGPKLCERLRNQLVGDYLREESAGCGVFLLVSLKASKKWTIDGNLVGVEGLALALKNYWKTIAHEYAGVEEIEVIVIDMNKRSMVSDT